MRVHFGAPPSVFVHSTGWRKLAEPSPHRLAQGGLLLGLCLGAVVSGLWHLGGIHVSAQFASVQGIAPLAVFLLSLVGLFALHEAIHALLHPGRRSRLEALADRGREAIQLAAGAGGMLLIAALIEAFWSPADIPDLLKVTVGILMWILVAVYLGLSGRWEDRAEARPADQRSERAPIPTRPTAPAPDRVIARRSRNRSCLASRVPGVCQHSH